MGEFCREETHVNVFVSDCLPIMSDKRITQHRESFEHASPSAPCNSLARYRQRAKRRHIQHAEVRRGAIPIDRMEKKPTRRRIITTHQNCLPLSALIQIPDGQHPVLIQHIVITF